jgi:hypothetical protein
MRQSAAGIWGGKGVGVEVQVGCGTRSDEGQSLHSGSERVGGGVGGGPEKASLEKQRRRRRRVRAGCRRLRQGIWHHIAKDSIFHGLISARFRWRGRSRRMREKQARTWEDAPVEAEPLLDDVSKAGREGLRFVISPNACRFAAFSSERSTLFFHMLPNSTSGVHSSLGS